MVTQYKDWTGDELRLLRRRRGLSQSALAALIPVSREAVANWELGTYRPSMRHLAALDALDVETRQGAT